MSNNFSNLLSSIKIANQHNLSSVKIPMTNLNKRFVYFLITTGILDGLSINREEPYRYNIHIPNNGLIIQNSSLDIYVNFFMCKIPTKDIRTFTNIHIYYKTSRYLTMKYKKLIKLMKYNSDKLYILSTSKGFLIAKDAIKYKTGGILICQFTL